MKTYEVDLEQRAHESALCEIRLRLMHAEELRQGAVRRGFAIGLIFGALLFSAAAWLTMWVKGGKIQ